MIIVRAAVMFSNGEIVEGHGYGDIADISNKLSLGGDRIYGFVASSGNFITPKDAAVIAFEANQIKEKVAELIPEDLWPELETE